MKRQNKGGKFGIVAWIFLAIISIGLIGSAYGQEIKDGIHEDQVIICVNGHVIDLSGNICKVFNVDDISLNDAQKDLYKNGYNNDVFDMEVID